LTEPRPWADRSQVFFFLKLMGNFKVALVLAATLLLVAALGTSPRIGVVPGEMGWWDWTYFAIGVLMFLSLGAMVVTYFFEPDLRLCGEPGVVPVWAEFFGVYEANKPSVPLAPLKTSAPLYHTPKQRLVAFTCHHCGAASEVPYVGYPCPYCGEAPAPASKKRSVFKSDSIED